MSTGRTQQGAERGRTRTGQRGRRPAPSGVLSAARGGARGEARGRARDGPGRPVRWLLASPLAHALEAVVLAVLGLVALLYLAQGREMELPPILAARLEARAEAVFAATGGAEVELGRIWLAIGEGGRLRLRAEDVRLGAPAASAGAGDGADGRGGDGRDGAAAERAAAPPARAGGGVTVPALEAALLPGTLLRPARAPRTLALRGASLDVTRRADGQLDFGFGTLQLRRRTPAEAIAALRDRLAREAMAPLRRLTLEDLALTFRDAASGRVWRIEGAALTLVRGDGALALALDADLPGRLSLRLTVPEAGAPTARLSALVDGVPAADLAAQAPALGWLAPLEAPVSGAVLGELGPEGRLGPARGALEIGPGRLAPEGGRALPFRRAEARFAYTPQTRRVRFDRLAVEAPGLSLDASGHADLRTGPDGRPEGLTAQLALAAGELRAGAALPLPVALSDGALDAAVTLAPFTVRIGQAGVTLGAGAPEARLPESRMPEARLTARGRVAARAGGWDAALELGAAELTPDQVLALWPVAALPGTRDWVARNLQAGRITEARAGLRLAPGARPDIAFTFGFREARIRALRGLPPIAGASGRAALGRERFTVTLEAGTLTPERGGPVDLAGTSFVVPDTGLKPGDGDLRLRTDSSVTAALSVLEGPPFRLLSRAGLAADIAQGRAALSARLRFPVGRRVTPDQLGFDMDGTLTGLRSSGLVPGRVLAAERLEVSADPTALAISGRATLDGVALAGRFRQPLGPGAGPAEVSARAQLTQESARAFGLRLPDGALSGAAPVEAALTLPRGAPATLALSSTLEGLGLRLPGLGWSKPAGAAGRFALSGRLGFAGAPPAFDTVALEAPGLEVRGRLALAPGGGLDRLTLRTARLGGWFDGALDLVGRGPGRPPAVELSGGTLDLPAATFGGGGGGGAGVPVRGRLDRLRITGDAVLTGLTADLAPQGGSLAGPFRGRVAGGPEVTGALAPGQGGRPAVTLRTQDAGRALAAAGVFDEARGGALVLRLVPGAQPGAWEGELEVDEIRVTSAPGLAALFDTLSIVGLLERLNGPGLLFNAIRASFRLTPGAVQLTSASAVGPSLGISADGVYDVARERIDIQGVLSPIFFVNAIGQLVSREGEGLFGFNYRVQGPADAPEVFVNPLSLLTPGAFRQIFRAAPPALPEEAGE